MLRENLAPRARAGLEDRDLARARPPLFKIIGGHQATHPPADDRHIHTNHLSRYNEQSDPTLAGKFAENSSRSNRLYTLTVLGETRMKIEGYSRHDPQDNRQCHRGP